jgi:cell division protein FtsW
MSKKKRQRTLDYSLLTAVLFLVTVGSIIVYSASSALGAKEFMDPGFFFTRHLARAGLGLAFLFAFLYIDYNKLRPFAKPLLLVVLTLLLYLVVSNDVLKLKGATRWLSFFGFSLQPSEMMKFVLILYVADVMVRKQDRLDDFLNGYMPMLFVISGTLALILVQPDLGTSCVIFAIIAMIFFAGKVKLTHLLGTVVFALPFGWITIQNNAYMKDRLTTFMDPWQDPQGSGYQIIQSLISFGNGGIFGQGLGQSKQKLLYLPDPHTDFIFAILGEEFGLLGTVAILAIFMFLFWRGLSIAASAPNLFGMLLATGITGAIAIAGLVNMAVTVSLLPTTGLPLPFISYGGTSLVLTLAAVGILLNISKSIDKPMNASETPQKAVARVA